MPHGPAHSTRADAVLPRRVDHLVVGAGFGGLCAAIGLDRAGERDWLLVERLDGVGGTWRANTYPGAACDVQSHLYSFSFAPNPDWSATFSPQPEILDYLERVAATSGVLDRCRFGVEVDDAHWDEAEGAWRVSTSHGEVLATTLISASGGLSEPRLPDIPGLASFGGEVFHSAAWRHDVDLAGRRVAVVGTGASAVQIVPEIAPVAAHLDVYQRTAPWVLPRGARRYSALERGAMRRVPGLRRAVRLGHWATREVLVPGFTRLPALHAPLRAAAVANLRRGVPHDADLRARLTPDFAIGCKRILLSNDYYPAIARDDVDLVTSPIDRVEADAVVTADGVRHPVDVVVVATGFETTEQPFARRVRGRDGRTLAQVWAATGMTHHRGTTVHGFPNYFQVIGANTALGHSSMVLVIEAQVRYVVDAVRTLRERGLRSVEPTEQAQRRWRDDVQRRLRRSVWNTGGCASWYVDAFGRNTTTWPRTTVSLRRALRRFDLTEHDTEHDTEHRTEHRTEPGTRSGVPRPRQTQEVDA